MSLFSAEDRTAKKNLIEQIKILDDRCDAVISTVRKKTGADAIREDAARQRAIYPRMLAGELSYRKTGQELVETADSVIAFVPTETTWRGSPRPHSIFTTPTGAMFGLDLYDRSLDQIADGHCYGGIAAKENLFSPRC